MGLKINYLNIGPYRINGTQELQLVFHETVFLYLVLPYKLMLLPYKAVSEPYMMFICI